jgi:hypothetical protein
MKHAKTPISTVLLVLLPALATMSSAGEQEAARPPAVPLEPIGAILDAFRSHQVVALGEGDHGNEQGHAFRLSLIRDPRFAATVNDIVVECGSARYQDVMDRFVRRADVPNSVLRQAWQNTTQPNPLCDRPIYEDFFRAVRAVNASLPNDRQLRVLLGDPPIDWDSVRTPEEVTKWIGERDRHAADLIRREVLAKNRRALVVYGDMHFRRKNVTEHTSGGWAPTLVGLLESTAATRVFTIWTNTITELAEVQADVAAWRAPSLAIVRGTVLGGKDFNVYAEDAVRFSPAPGQPPPPATPPSQKPSLRMEEQFDAILYLGPLSSITIARISPALCADAPYMEMRLRRMALMPGPPGPQHRWNGSNGTVPVRPSSQNGTHCSTVANQRVAADSGRCALHACRPVLHGPPTIKERS